MATVAIARSLPKPFITAPILGLSKKEVVDESVSTIFLELTTEDLKSIDDLYEPKKVIGHA
jgi:aryl-alcohol dehydrogenase-like predicted oxidoreductase